jgi:hypothetical protein
MAAETPEDKAFSRKRALWALVFFLMAAIWVPIIWTQLVRREARYRMGQFQKGKMEIHVKSSRPLEIAAVVLSNRHGTPISSEDARGVPSVKDRGYIVPLDLTYEVDEKSGAPKDPRGVVEALVAQYNEKGQADQFVAREGEGFLHILPVREKNAAGEAVEARPVLDARITTPVEEYDGQSAIGVFRNALQEQSLDEWIEIEGPDPVLGLAWKDMPWRQKPEGWTAREVLVMILGAAPGRYSWTAAFEAPPDRPVYRIRVFEMPPPIQ